MSDTLRRLAATSPHWWDRFRARAVLLLLLHPAELAEFSIGFVALVSGLALAFDGQPMTSRGADAIGGILLALFGLPQMIAAFHGSIRARHWSNVAGCFATLANLIRVVRAEIPVAIAFYLAIFVLCLFFLGRTEVALYLVSERKGDPAR